MFVAELLLKNSNLNIGAECIPGIVMEAAVDILPFNAPFLSQMQMHILLYHKIFLFKCALHGMNETEPFCLMTRLSGTKN